MAALTREDWLSRAAAILAEIRALLAPLGIAVSDELRVVADTHPCPGYRHDVMTIGFCPPVVESAVERLRWVFFAKAMGCASIDEVRAFYDVALPFVVAHETSHHLRTSAGLDAGSHFVEEQACDKLAAAIVEALPRHAPTLPRLRERCALLREALAATNAVGPARAFMPDVTDVAAHDPATRARLDELRAITSREGLSYAALAQLVPELDEANLREAEVARTEARRHLDVHYARDPSEYWYASVVWLERYLASPARPSLADALNTHLLGTAGTDAETVYALLDALRGEDVVVAEGAAAALLTQLGAAVVHDLVDEVERASNDRLRPAIVRTLATDWEATWDRAAAERVVSRRRAESSEELLEVLRLALRARVDPAPRLAEAREVVARGETGALASLLVAIEGDPRSVLEALADPERADVVLEALLAQGRTIADAGHELTRSLPARGSPRWEGLLRVAGDAHGVTPSHAPLGAPRENARPTLRAAAFAADLAGRDPRTCPAVAEQVALALGAVSALGSLRAELGPGSDLVGLARAILEDARRCTLLEIVAALSPAKNRVRKAELLPTVTRPGPIPPVLVDLLVSDLDDARLGPLLRDEVVASAELEADPAAVLAGLGPVARAALARALPVSRAFASSPEEPNMATLLDKILHLRRVPLFSALSAERLAEIARLTIERAYAPGEPVVRVGEPGDELYLLVEGEVCVSREDGGRRVVMATLGPPSFFGEMTLFDARPRSADVIAVGPCRLLSIDGIAIRRVGRRHPEVYEGLLAILSERVRAASRGTSAHRDD